MLILIFALLSYFSSVEDKKIEPSIIEKVEKEAISLPYKPRPYGFSIYGTYHKNYFDKDENENIDIFLYGLSLEYEISNYFTLSGLIGSTDINYQEGAEKYTDHGLTYGLRGDFSSNYKNLFYGINIDLLHTNMHWNDNFNTFGLTPRLGYINDSKNFKFWFGAIYQYRNQEFKIDIKNSQLIPTIGVEYRPIPSLELSTNIRFKDSYSGINLQSTYKF